MSIFNQNDPYCYSRDSTTTWYGDREQHFRIDVLPYGGELTQTIWTFNYTEWINLHGYNRHDNPTYKYLMECVSRSTGIPTDQQVFKLGNEENSSELDAKESDDLSEVFRKYHKIGNWLVLYLFLTSKPGYTGPGATFRYMVIIKPFGSQQIDTDPILSKEMIFNTAIEKRLIIDFPNLDDLAYQITDKTGIRNENQVLLNEDGNFIHWSWFSSLKTLRYFRETLHKTDGDDIILFLSVRPNYLHKIGELDNNMRQICEKFHIHYLEDVLLRSLTKTETLTYCQEYKTIREVRLYIDRTRQIPIHAQRLMVNGFELHDEQLLSVLFWKHSRNTNSLTIDLIVQPRMINLRLMCDHYTFAQDNMTVSELDTILEVKSKIANMTGNLFPPDYTEVLLWHSLSPYDNTARSKVRFKPNLRMLEHHVTTGMMLIVTKLVHIRLYEPKILHCEYIDFKIENETQTFIDLLNFIKERKQCKRKHLHVREMHPDNFEITSETLLFNGDSIVNEIVLDMDKKSNCSLQ